MSYPDTCDICGNAKPFIKNLDDQKWYCVGCAAHAGNEGAARVMMQKGAHDMIERMMMPTTEIEVTQ